MKLKPSLGLGVPKCPNFDDPRTIYNQTLLRQVPPEAVTVPSHVEVNITTFSDDYVWLLGTKMPPRIHEILKTVDDGFKSPASL